MLLSKIPPITPQEFLLPSTSPPVGTGRREVPYEAAMPSTKRKRTQKLAKEREMEELLDAAQKKAVAQSNPDLAFVIKKMKIARWDDG